MKIILWQREGIIEVSVNIVSDSSLVLISWAKWKWVSCIILDKDILARYKFKMYTRILRPVVMYTAETWALMKSEQQLDRTELWMVRWILEISLFAICVVLRPEMFLACVCNPSDCMRMHHF